MSKGNDLLNSMMDERWTSQKAPLLVLSCSNSSEDEDQRLTCIDVVEELKLCEMNRRWQVSVNAILHTSTTICLHGFTSLVPRRFLVQLKCHQLIQCHISIMQISYISN